MRTIRPEQFSESRAGRGIRVHHIRTAAIRGVVLGDGAVHALARIAIAAAVELERVIAHRVLEATDRDPRVGVSNPLVPPHAGALATDDAEAKGHVPAPPHDVLQNLVAT